MSISRRENIGFTSGGKQEVCRWKSDIPCPRHSRHGVLKFDMLSLKELTVFENPVDPASNLTLESYLKATEEVDDERSLESIEDLTELEKIRLEDRGRIKIDDVWYAVSSDDSNYLNEIRVIENDDDLTDIEMRELQEQGFISIDGVGYFYNNDGDFRISENEHGQTMGMLNRHIKSLDSSLVDYVDKNANKNQTLNTEVEQWFMTGGCGVYALALQDLNPTYMIAVDKYWCEGEDLYNHVFCVDPDTNRAYDSRGEFSSPEALMDYKSDPHSGILPSSGEDDEDNYNELSDMFEDDGYIFWSRAQADHMVGVGTFTFVTDDTDQHYIKSLIKGFDKRYKL